MASLPDPAIITVNGDYDITVYPGLRHKFALKGDFGGATVTMKILDRALTDDNGGAPVYVDVIGAVFTDVTEGTLEPTSRSVRLSVSGAGGSTEISVSCIELK